MNSFSDQADKEYYQDQNYISTEQAEKVRQLWQWINENEEINEQLTLVQNKKFYLYKNKQKQLIPVI